MMTWAASSIALVWQWFQLRCGSESRTFEACELLEYWIDGEEFTGLYSNISMTIQRLISELRSNFGSMHHAYQQSAWLATVSAASLPWYGITDMPASGSSSGWWRWWRICLLFMKLPGKIGKFRTLCQTREMGVITWYGITDMPASRSSTSASSSGWWRWWDDAYHSGSF